MKKGSTKSAILDAFDQSERKSIAEVCRIVGINRTSFYFHFNRDMKFRREFVCKQQRQLAEKLRNN